MSGLTTSRREFLRVAAAGAASCWVTSQSARGDEPKSPSDRPLVGWIGAGDRGVGDAKWAAQFGDIAAICDVDLERAQQGKAEVAPRADVYQDYRRLLDRNDLEVIVNATPDHWHTAINVAACKSGKDVYAEKPLTLTIDEGKILRRVVQETGRIVQVGTQQRSDKGCQQAVELVRNGRVGKLRQIWVALPYFSTRGGPFAAKPVPPQLNWDMFQGQAPEHPYCPERAQRNFRWWYEYAGGIVTDWGNHHMDIAHWGADCELTGPLSVEARGLFPNHGEPDCFNTPDRFFSRMVYPNGVEILFFSALGERLLYGGVAKEHEATAPEMIGQLFGDDCPEEIKSFDRNGIMFIGDQGRIFVNRGGIYGKPYEMLKDHPLPEDAWRARPSSDHMGNFFECVKTRQEPVSPVHIQHRTATACHLTNLSIRLGRKLAWDAAAEQIVGDDEAAGWLKRTQRPPYQIEA